MTDQKTVQAADEALRFDRDEAATLDEQVAAAQRLTGAGEAAGEYDQASAAPAKSPEECAEALRKRLAGNHGNTLAYLACLKACLGDPRPYREVEESLLGSAAFALSTQTPHTLIGLLVADGGIERIEVAEGSEGAIEGEAATGAEGADEAHVASEPAEQLASALAAPVAPEAPALAAGDLVAVSILAGEAPAPAFAAEAPAPATEPAALVFAPASESGAAQPAPEAPASAEQPASAPETSASTAVAASEVPASAPAPADQPVDFLLATTPVGRAVLAEYDVAARLERLVASEPEGYLDAYLVVLDACEGEGATLKQIEAALCGHPALSSPKRVYAGYFISKLETVGAIAWRDAWHITDDGRRALEALAAQPL